jgi:hypothetical protein
VSIRCTTTFNVDITDGLVQGVSGKLMKLVTGRIKEDPMAENCRELG